MSEEAVKYLISEVDRLKSRVEFYKDKAENFYHEKNILKFMVSEFRMGEIDINHDENDNPVISIKWHEDNMKLTTKQVKEFTAKEFMELIKNA